MTQYIMRHRYDRASGLDMSHEQQSQEEEVIQFLEIIYLMILKNLVLRHLEAYNRGDAPHFLITNGHVSLQMIL